MSVRLDSLVPEVRGLMLPQPMIEVLETAYSTPIRAYHHLGHVAEVMECFAEVDAGPGWARPHEVALAVLYHDAIYEAGRSDNEQRSAQLAAGQIRKWLPDEGIDVGRVVELIELTAGHGQHVPEQFGAGPDADDSRHFLDCDMAILGADAERFDAYDRGIAAEYRGCVPGWQYRLGRRRFLKGLLRRDRIYLSEFFHTRCDARARANLRRAITARR